MIFSGREWGCLFVRNTYLRGRHLFEGVAYFKKKMNGNEFVASECDSSVVVSRKNT